MVEAVERRTFLSAAVLANGVLTVTGTAGADAIDVTIGREDPVPSAVVDVTVNGAKQSFDSATDGAIRRVVVNAGDGNDTVDVDAYTASDTPGRAADPAVSVAGGRGDDVLGYAGFGSAAQPTLDGGDGNDDLAVVNEGSVAVYVTEVGGSGNDTLVAGDAIAELDVGMSGGAGDDTFVVQNQNAAAAISGGAGTDTLALTSEGDYAYQSVTIDMTHPVTATVPPTRVTAKYYLEADVENVIGDTSSGRVSVTGNGLANVIRVDLDNTGSATVHGGGGDDTIDVRESTTAVLYGDAGNDAITANGGATTVYGGDGNDTVYAADGGPTTVDGGGGTDSAYVDAAGDTTANVEVVIPPALTGTPIGTAGSFGNAGNTAAKAVDGDLATFFDAPTANGAFVGLDLGAAATVTAVSFAPRVGYANRMVGGRFQGSNSPTFAVAVTDLYTVTAAPAVGRLTTVPVTAAGSFRYVRYLAPNGAYGNVAEVNFHGTPAAASVQLTGTTIGTAGSYNNHGNTVARATDGDLTTFFDAPNPSGAFVGLDLGTARVVNRIGFAPRDGYAARMVGGYVQGSNDAAFVTGVETVYTVTAAPAVGTLTTVAIRPGALNGYRYWRYVGPAGGYCNIAEFQLFT